jgi:hypothetical protein
MRAFEAVRHIAIRRLAAAQGASAQESKICLFKVITVKDEIVIGLTDAELTALGGHDAGAVAHAGAFSSEVGTGSREENAPS